jgi:exportin-T
MPSLIACNCVAVLAVGEENRERGELQKAFFILLHAVTANELSAVVIEMDSGVLDLLLQALLANASSHSEAGIRRACFQVCLHFY